MGDERWETVLEGIQCWWKTPARAAAVIALTSLWRDFEKLEQAHKELEADYDDAAQRADGNFESYDRIKEKYSAAERDREQLRTLLKRCVLRELQAAIAKAEGGTR